MSDSLKTGHPAARHLGGQTALVMGGTVYTFLVGVPFQIYLARSLGASGLGVVGIAEALVLMAAGLLSFGLAPLVVRYIPEYRVTGASHAIRSLLRLGLGVLCGVGALGAGLLQPLVSAFSDLASIPAESADVLGILVLLLPASMIVFFLAQALRGFEEIRIVVFSTSILQLTAKVAISLVLFMSVGASVRAYAWAVVLSQVAAAVPMAVVLWRLVRSLPSDGAAAPLEWRAWASYAATNYATGLLNTLVGNLDRVVVGALLGPSAVGALMVVRQLQQFPMVFHQMVLTVVSPVFARLKADRDMAGLAHQLHLANDWVLRMAAGLIVVLALFAAPILALYGSDFVDQGTALMVLMTLAAAINLGTGPVGILLNMTGHHVVLLRIMILTALFTFVGYFLLIPMMGLAGAGLAILLATLANKIAAILLVRSRLGIRWYDPRFRGWIAPTLGAVGMLFLLRPVLAGLEGVTIQAAALVGVTLLTYLVFFSINVIAGLHSDDREVLSAMRERIAGIRRRNEQKI